MSTSNILLVTGRPGIGKTTLVSHVFEELLKNGIQAVGFKTEEVRQFYSGKSTRFGFDVVLFDSSRTYPRASLARLINHSSQQVQHQPRVGQYLIISILSSEKDSKFPLFFWSIFLIGNDNNQQSIINDLENVSSINNVRKDDLIICIIDEIGKMELCSSKFTYLIEKLISSISNLPTNSQRDIKHPTVVLLATVPSPKRQDGTRGIPLVDHICSVKGASIIEIDLSNRNKIIQEIMKRILKCKSS
uniref:Cancer-related nucleoside-triphosphatase-like protein n=1 Tax=Schistosoma haematobium TaxID=6185 RepID=A0A095CB56_SCHHA